MSNLIREYIHRPQRLWIRKAMFQVHLWVGLLLVVYAILIGVSGSILVLREEFEKWTGLNPDYGEFVESGSQLNYEQVVVILKEKFPKSKVSLLYPPREKNKAYYAFLTGGRKQTIVNVHPYTGAILNSGAPEKNWMTVVSRIHYFLLMDRNPGMTINGISSALIVVMTLTGLVIWWPGISQWVRAFVVDFRKNWKRVNWDLHNVMGFWTLFFVIVWGISGLYLIWPREFVSTVNVVSKVTMSEGRMTGLRASSNPTGTIHQLQGMISHAETIFPNTHVGAISFPTRDKAPLMFYMVKNDRETLSGADHVYYDPANGKHLQTGYRNNPQTMGDWFVWLQRPLHYGTWWGTTVKIIWFIIGFALPLLGITGLLMYWNRYLGKKWKKLKSMPESRRVTVVQTQ